MKFSRNYPFRKHFFSKKKILSPNQALFFIVEEFILLVLIIVQLYYALGVRHTDKALLFFQYTPPMQNILWLLGSIGFLFVGYLVIVLRDETVNNIHKNFSKALFFSLKEKIKNTRKEVAFFVLAEIMFAVIIALSIYVYLDPEVNLVPFPFNYVGFAFFLGISYLFFSHTKNFRSFVYGPTPIQKRIHLGRHEIVRLTNKKTGSIRIGTRHKYK
jgi:hypothetical protein